MYLVLSGIQAQIHKSLWLQSSKNKYVWDSTCQPQNGKLCKCAGKLLLSNPGSGKP